MANTGLKEVDPGLQWAIAFSLGILTWFVAISFVRVLPAALQLLSMLFPIACFAYALYVLPKWQETGKRKDLINSLKEREFAHRMMRQHHLNLTTDDLGFDGTLRELEAMYAVEEPQQNVTPHAQLSLPEQATYLLKIQQEVMQSCGDIGWALVEYVSGRGTQYCDQDGWISLEKLRSNWGRNLGLSTENLKQLLIALNNIQIGEWRDSSLREWRLLLTR
ncbi:hypothetical protein [Phormidesmis priestleyi]